MLRKFEAIQANQKISQPLIELGLNSMATEGKILFFSIVVAKNMIIKTSLLVILATSSVI